VYTLLETVRPENPILAGSRPPIEAHPQPWGRPGRPAIAKEVRDLIRKMSESNPAWGSPRIRSELVSLGFFTAPTVRFEVLFVLIIIGSQ